MRIHGFFDEQFEPPAPFMKATLELKSLRLRHPINLHVDTGASITALLDRDVELLGIKVEDLKKAERQIGGIGGFADTYVIEDAALVFKAEKGQACREKLRLFAIKHDVSKLSRVERNMIMLLPSLLGRDVIYRFKLVCDRARNAIYLERNL